MHRPSKHTPRTLQLWLTRFGVMLPELPGLLGKPEEALGRLYSMLDIIHTMVANLRDGKTEDGEGVISSKDDSMESIRLWSARETRVMHSIVNCAIAMKDDSIESIRLWSARETRVMHSIFNCAIAMKDDSMESIRLWSARETRVMHSIVNCAIAMKVRHLEGRLDGVHQAVERAGDQGDALHLQLRYRYEDDSMESIRLWSARETRDFRLAADTLSTLLQQATSPMQRRANHSALCRLWLLCGHEAYNNFARAADQEPTNIMDMGLIDIAHGKYQEAYNNFARAADQEPTNIMVANNLSVCLLYMGRLKEAIAVLQKAINSDPERGLHESLLVNLCTLYELESSKTTEKKLNLLRMLCKYKSDTIPNVV
ncbi:putative d-alanyl-d-alanine carboxypeptidase, partial [Operophtera brumata]